MRFDVLETDGPLERMKWLSMSLLYFVTMQSSTPLMSILWSRGVLQHGGGCTASCRIRTEVDRII